MSYQYDEVERLKQELANAKRDSEAAHKKKRPKAQSNERRPPKNSPRRPILQVLQAVPQLPM